MEKQGLNGPEFGDQKQDPLVFWDGLTISCESQSPSEWTLTFSLFHAYIWRKKKRESDVDLIFL